MISRQFQNHRRTQRPLTGPLWARINRLAHTQALQHETRLKASHLEQVQTARDGGASFDELAALVALLEAAPARGVGGFQRTALTGTGHHTVRHARLSRLLENNRAMTKARNRWGGARKEAGRKHGG